MAQDSGNDYVMVRVHQTRVVLEVQIPTDLVEEMLEELQEYRDKGDRPRDIKFVHGRLWGGAYILADMYHTERDGFVQFLKDLCEEESRPFFASQEELEEVLKPEPA